MSNTVKRFDYRITKADKGEQPFDPFVEIVVAKWSARDDKVPVISAYLATDEEIDTWVAALKLDLDDVGRRAKAARQSAHKETQAGTF